MPLTIKSVTLRNRIGGSPMCQYSAEDGAANDWHLVHLGARAAGGAVLVLAAATAMSPAGRISPGDAGRWSDRHIDPLIRSNRFVKDQGPCPASTSSMPGARSPCRVAGAPPTRRPDRVLRLDGRRLGPGAERRARLLKAEGVDRIDCSSADLVPEAKIPVGPGYQVPGAERSGREAGIATAAVGMITAPTHADEIVRNRRADPMLLAREVLRDGQGRLRAARTLGQAAALMPPIQYQRAW